MVVIIKVFTLIIELMQRRTNAGDPSETHWSEDRWMNHPMTLLYSLKKTHRYM